MAINDAEKNIVEIKYFPKTWKKSLKSVFVLYRDNEYHNLNVVKDDYCKKDNIKMRNDK